MKQKCLLFLSFSLFFALLSCSDEETYIPVSSTSALTERPGGGNADAPVNFNLAQVALPKLSDYHFFVGQMKDQVPNYLVIPYRPASELFSDYALKKRFVWMPRGSSATYNGDGNTLEFPVGTVLIKTFYYNNVQPANVVKIIETRLLIRIHAALTGDSGWRLYDYIWNDAQTEAFLDSSGNGVFIPLTFTENSITRNITYKIPASTECITCHKLNPTHMASNQLALPIGLKPQNLNFNYNYGAFTRNQLLRLKQIGYIDNTLPALTSINSTVDWRDSSQPLQTRARSYIDANCAHCHRPGGQCDYTPMRFEYNITDLSLFGVCMGSTSIDNPFIINSGQADQSYMITTMSSQDESIRMPLIGRTVVHEEAVALVSQWINSLTGTCH